MSAIAGFSFEHAVGCGMRTLGLFSLLPLGWDLFGFGVRLTLTASVTYFLFPGVTGSPPPDFLNLPIEFCLGLALALPAALLIECASNAGELFDTLRGQTLATVYDPLQQETSPVSGTIAKFALWAFLLSSGTALHLVRGLSESFTAVPLGAFQFQELSHIGRNAIIFIPGLMTETFAACLPFAAACIGCEAVLGLMTKQLPGINLQTEGSLAKFLVAVALVSTIFSSGALERLSSMAQPVLALLQIHP